MPFLKLWPNRHPSIRGQTDEFRRACGSLLGAPTVNTSSFSQKTRPIPTKGRHGIERYPPAYFGVKPGAPHWTLLQSDLDFRDANRYAYCSKMLLPPPSFACCSRRIMPGRRSLVTDLMAASSVWSGSCPLPDSCCRSPSVLWRRRNSGTAITARSPCFGGWPSSPHRRRHLHHDHSRDRHSPRAERRALWLLC